MINWTLQAQQYLGDHLLGVIGSGEVLMLLVFLAVLVIMFIINFASDFRLPALLLVAALFVAPVAWGGLGILSDTNPYWTMVLIVSGAIIGFGIIKLGGMK